MESVLELCSRPIEDCMDLQTAVVLTGTEPCLPWRSSPVESTSFMAFRKEESKAFRSR